MNKIICGIFCTFFIYNVNFAYAGQLPNIQQEQQMISRERDSEREQALHQRDELQDHANMSEDMLPEEKIAYNSCDLLGTAVGLRGKVGRKAYWEAFVSWALKKPADMPNGKQVYGFKYMREL